MITSTKLDPFLREDSGKRITEFEVPSGGLQTGHLLFSKGVAPEITLEADTSPSRLFRAHFEHPVPDVYVDGGVVTIEYPHHFRSLLQWAHAPGRVRLTTSIPWSIAVRGGISTFTANLESLRLTELEVTGGMSDVVIVLPPPTRTVEISITGGVSNLRLKRPSGVPVRVVVTGGASDLKLDDNYFGAIGGETRWESTDYKTSVDRYAISITGGASAVAIETI